MDKYDESAAYYSESLRDWFNAGEKQQRNRDRWIIDEWIKSHGMIVSECDVQQGECPDFFVNGQPIEVTEAQKEGRRRGDEYKEVIELAENIDANAFCMEFYNGADNGLEWIRNAVQKKMDKYSDLETSCWVLVVYANFWGIESLDFNILRDKVYEMLPPFSGIDVLYQGVDNQEIPVYKVDAIWKR